MFWAPQLALVLTFVSARAAMMMAVSKSSVLCLYSAFSHNFRAFFWFKRK